MKKTGLRTLVISVSVAIALVFAAVIGYVAYERSLEKEQDDAIKILREDAGMYDESVIVLADTTHGASKAIADKIGAKLRITDNGRFAVLTLPKGKSIADVYADDTNRKYIKRMSPDYYAYTSEEIDESSNMRQTSAPKYTVSDSGFASQSYINYLNIGDAWTATRGSGITVAVIDTGIDTDHPEFSGRISEYSYNASEDKIVKDYTLEGGGYDWSLIEDEQGHGTSVAGVIASAMNGDGVVGIAPEVNIIVIKCECDENGQFTRTSDLVFGLYYAIERDVSVVNMSFGSAANQNPFAEATRLAVDSDIICVAAAGNESSPIITYPAADENVIGVGALESDGWELAEYSNYGENVDVVAPGTTYTTKKGGIYGTTNGTSLACPTVTGAIALYCAQNTYIEFADVTERLYASCYDLGDLGCDFYYGYGALDVSAFICEQAGVVTFNMLTDELENTEQIFIRNHTLQDLPEPERNYAVFDGWYYDIDCTDELQWYEDVWTADLTLYASWVNEDDGVPYTYVTLDDGTVEIRSYTGKRRFITLPDMIDGKVVSSIGDFAFEGQSRLRSVRLPSGLKNIGLCAFNGCSNIVSVSIPQSVVTIGQYAFADNVRLSSVTFEGESKLASIGSFAFSRCGELRQFNVPASVTALDGSAFYGDIGIKSFTVDKRNPSFKDRDGAIYSKTGSTVVAYPAGLTGTYDIPNGTYTVGAYAFAYSRMSEILLSNVTSIGSSAFAYSFIESAVIPDSVTQIGIKTYENAVYLSSVSIGKGLMRIPEKAFCATAIRTVILPDNITVIGQQSFRDTSKLTSVIFEEKSKLISIEKSAFCASSLESIVIPKSCTYIGERAFTCNSRLATVMFENESNLTGIGEYAFFNTVCVTEITLPSRLAVIGDYAFQNSGLTSVNVPSSVESLGAGAFASCLRLENIFVDDENARYTDIDGVVYSKDKAKIHAYPAANARTAYTIDSAVTEVFDAAFMGSFRLNTVKLPPSLVTVGEYGFSGCTGMTGYTLPNTLMYIEAYAFANNTGLYTGIRIPDNVIQISNFAFADDYRLNSITFTENSKLSRISYAAFAYTGISNFTVPKNVSTVAQYAFEGCNSLTGITFAQGSKLESVSAYMFLGCDNIQSITFEQGSMLGSIQAHGFEGMRSLTSINFGDAPITNIDNYAFRFCESLQTLTIPDGVTYIGRFAFYGCKALTQMNIPSSVDFIGRYAFHYAENLDLYFTADTLPANLQEDWDSGIRGYYVGVTDVVENDEWKYAELTGGGRSIIGYKGTSTAIDLTAVDLGGDIVTVGGNAFANTAVQSVVLPETLTSIQQYAFANTHLTCVVIPENVTFIGKYAFNNTDITYVTFDGESKLYNLEQYAFSKCEKLTTVKIPASLAVMGRNTFSLSGITSADLTEYTMNEIPESAFSGTKLQNIIIPDCVTLINHNAFRDCTELTSVVFGAGENLQLMSNTFYNTGLTSLYIPENLTYVGEYSFVGLRDLTAFTVDENNTKYTTIDGLLYSKDGRKLIACPAGKTGEITLPQNLEILGFGAFENSGLTRISFNENSNILTFGYRCFYNSDLTEIDVPASVVSFDYYAFAMCDELVSVNLAESNKLNGIYEGAFYGCKNLTNITLPDSIVEISDYAFYGCVSLYKMPVSETSKLKGIYDYSFAYCGFNELYLPDEIIDIGSYAFLANDMREVTVSDANKYELIIGIGAFAECNQLESITLPFIGASFEDDKITWFGYIFGAGGYEANDAYTPNSVKNVTIYDGISFIGTNAFCKLTELQKVNVPESVSEIYKYAFYECSAVYELVSEITTCYYNYKGELRPEYDVDNTYIGKGMRGTLKLSNEYTNLSILLFEPMIEEVIIPESVTRIVFVSLYGFPNHEQDSPLKRFIIPDTVRELGSISINNHGNLTEVYLPRGATGLSSFSVLGCNSLEKIEYPDSVEFDEIREQCFSGCKSIRKIRLPDGIKRIEPHAFMNCSSLAEFVIPESVEYIGSGAFWNCESLTEIVIPEGVTQIEDYTFTGCSNLTEVVLPDGILSVGVSAFQSCKSLKSITLPASLLSLGNQSFYFCSSLKDITLPERLTYIGTDCFTSCYLLDTIINRSGVDITFDSEVIRHSPVYRIVNKDGSVSLNEDVIPSDHLYDELIVTDEGYVFTRTGTEYTLTEYIGDKDEIVLPETINGNKYRMHWFKCSSHTVTIPGSFTNISYGAFELNTFIRSVIIEDGVSSIDSYAFSNCTKLQIISIPDSVLSIGYGAFTNCRALKNVSLPDSVSEISANAFYSCTGLETVRWSSSCNIIPTSVFELCSNLSMVSNIDKIDAIGSKAFYLCSRLSNLFISADITEIGINALNGVKSINVSPDSEKYENIGGLLCDVENKKIVFVNKDTKSVTIPNYINDISSVFIDCNSLVNVDFEENSELKEIGADAFKNCTSLTSIKLPEGINVIRSNAFYECRALTGINFPDGLTEIEESCFWSCYGLKNIVLPDSVTEIGQYAFTNCLNMVSFKADGLTRLSGMVFLCCRKLESFHIGATLAYIGSPFQHCNSLKKVTIDSDNEYFTVIDGILYNKDVTELLCVLPEVKGDIIIPTGVTSIPQEAFYATTAIDSIYFPDSISTMGLDILNGCSATHIRLPDGIKKIEAYAFRCGNFVTLNIPEGVESIGSNAFAWNKCLTTVTLPSTLKQINTDAFTDCDGLYQIVNNSDLDLTFGSELNGKVAYYAAEIVDADGNVSQRDAGIRHIKTEDGFVFEYKEAEDQYTLQSYLGSDYEVTLPLTVNGHSYLIGGVYGAHNVIIPEGITVINRDAFSNNYALRNVTLPSSLSTIEDRAFTRTSIQEVVIPEQVISIAPNAFEYCNKLTSVYISDSVEQIGDSAFASCENLTTIRLPDNGMQIGNDAFASIAYANNINNWIDGGLYIGKCLIDVDENISSFEIKAGIRTVADGAFKQCDKMSNLVSDISLPKHLSTLVNLESLVLNSAFDSTIIYCFDTNVPLTLKSVVLGEGFDLRNAVLFEDITGINIFVTKPENDVQWDHDYPGWNNGNKARRTKT